MKSTKSDKSGKVAEADSGDDHTVLERKGNDNPAPALVLLPLDYVSRSLQLLLRACKERARIMQLLPEEQIVAAAPFSPQLDLDVQQFLESAHLLDTYVKFEANSYARESPQGLSVAVVGEALKSSLVKELTPLVASNPSTHPVHKVSSTSAVTTSTSSSGGPAPKSQPTRQSTEDKDRAQGELHMRTSHASGLICLLQSETHFIAPTSHAQHVSCRCPRAG